MRVVCCDSILILWPQLAKSHLEISQTRAEDSARLDQLQAIKCHSSKVTFAGFCHKYTHVCVCVCVRGPFKCYIMLNIQFNVPYKSCRSFLCCSCPNPENCLTPASRVCLSVPKSSPALCSLPFSLPCLTHFCRNPISCPCSCFVFIFFGLCLAFCFCFPALAVVTVFRFKPLSNACSFLLAPPVDGLHLFSIRLGFCFMLTHIYNCLSLSGQRLISFSEGKRLSELTMR